MPKIEILIDLISALAETARNRNKRAMAFFI
jgi:hypothetical protein